MTNRKSTPEKRHTRESRVFDTSKNSVELWMAEGKVKHTSIHKPAVRKYCGADGENTKEEIVRSCPANNFWSRKSVSE